MLNFKMREARKDESPYIYRLSIVCLGRTLELGVSYDDISNLKNKSRIGLSRADIKSRFTKLSAFRSRKGRNSKARPANKKVKAHSKQD